MPSQTWINAASQTNRKPVLCLGIESVDAISASIYDKAGWDASSVKTNVNTASAAVDPGVVVLDTDGMEAVSNLYPSLPVAVPSGNSYPKGSIWETWANYTYSRVSQPGTSQVVNWTDPRVTKVDLALEYYNADITWAGVNTITPQTSTDGITWHDEGAQNFLPNTGKTFINFTFPVTKGRLYLRLVLSTTVYAAVSGLGLGVIWWSYTLYHQTNYLPTGFLRTKSVDLGLVPTANSVVAISDKPQSDAPLSYQAFGSNDTATWTDLGAVQDGSSVAPYRYYQFAVSFASLTGQETPLLRSIGVTGGDNQYKYYSTHPDTPVKGALPYLLPDIGALSSTIQLMKLGSTGEAAPSLFYLPDTFDLLQNGFLRNKTVQLLLGFEGVALEDYEPIFTGLWYDGTVDLARGTIAIKTRTVFSLFQKVQLPAEKALGGLRDAETCPPWYRIGAPIIETMLDVLDLLGIPGRYIDTASFNALNTGAFSGPNWLVSRRIDKDSKTDAIKLLEELSVLAGIFVVPQPDGVITPTPYDPTVLPTIELTPDVATFSQVQLGQGELYTRQQILYTPKHKNDLTDGVAHGTWVNGGLYSTGQRIIDPLTGIIYHCYTQHGATDDTEPGYGAGWRSFWYVRWAPSTAYGDSAPAQLIDPEHVVVHNFTIYTCTAALAAANLVEPGVTSGWQNHWSAGATLLQSGATLSNPGTDPWLWQPGVDYARADTVWRAGVLYRCLLQHNSGSAAAGSNPLEPAVGTARRAYWATEWLPEVNYQPGDVVTHQGPLCTCIANHAASADNEPIVGPSYQTYWYTDPVVTSDSPEDFYNAYVLINNLAEVNWGLNADVPEGDPNYQVSPGYQQNWAEKWNATDYARQQLAARMDSWYANPKMSLTASNLPPSFYQVMQGTLVGVSGLVLPCAGVSWEKPCKMKPFLVVKKQFDPLKCLVTLDLKEVTTVRKVTGVNPAVLSGRMVISFVGIVLADGNPFVDGQTVVVAGVGSGIDGTRTVVYVDANTIALQGVINTAPVWSGSGTVSSL